MRIKPTDILIGIEVGDHPPPAIMPEHPVCVGLSSNKKSLPAPYTLAFDEPGCLPSMGIEKTWIRTGLAEQGLVPYHPSVTIVISADRTGSVELGCSGHCRYGRTIAVEFDARTACTISTRWVVRFLFPYKLMHQDCVNAQPHRACCEIL